MISKGVDYYAYLSGSPFNVKFQIPSDWGNGVKGVSFSAAERMGSGNFQITEEDIGMLDHTGRYQWTAYQNSNSLGSRYVDIAPSTGNMGSTNMGNMLQTPSHISSNYALSYGFYDSGPGWGSLTNQDQSYVYITDNYSNWMGDLARAMPAILDKPLSTFSLVGAHDAGMFDMTCAQSLLHNATFLGLLGGLLGFAVTDLSASVIMRGIINFAVTQKDNVPTMLDLGVRYFDFRPGYCYPRINNNLYHQHKFIPGYPYASFLNDVLYWLKEHPNEIVVVSANFQGFYSDEMKPTVDTLNTYLNNALAATGTQGSIIPGDKHDMQTSVRSLIAAKKRLIFLNQVGASNDATKYDSYSDSYQTTDVNTIIAALNGMTSSGQNSADYTVLQLQGTATATGGGIFTSVATMSDASSPLMSTKPGFDHSTYPWLQQHVASKFQRDKLIIFLNDFADNALVNYGIGITKQRM